MSASCQTLLIARIYRVRHGLIGATTTHAHLPAAAACVQDLVLARTKLKMQNALLARVRNRQAVTPALAHESENGQSGPSVRPLAAAGSKAALDRACLAKTAKERNHKRGIVLLIAVQNGQNGVISEYAARHAAEEKPYARETANLERAASERTLKLFLALRSSVQFGVSGQLILNVQFLAATENSNDRENAKMEIHVLANQLIPATAPEGRVRNGRPGADSLHVQNHAAGESQSDQGNAPTGLKAWTVLDQLKTRLPVMKKLARNGQNGQNTRPAAFHVVVEQELLLEFVRTEIHAKVEQNEINLVEIIPALLGPAGQLLGSAQLRVDSAKK